MPRAMVLRFDVGRQRHLAHMHFQDLLAADHVRVGHHDLAVEAARTQQRRIEHVRPVGGGDQDDAFIGLEAVHLDEQLVQRLLALVVAAAEAGAAMAADRVDFVDEDDAGRVLLRLLEHVAHAARADADEHFDEVGARDGEERHVGLAGDGAGEQRLAGAGRADQQHAARNAAAEPLEFLRVAQEFDDLLQILLGLVDAGDILEGDAAMRLGQQLGPRFAEAERLAARALHLPRQEDPHADERNDRQTVDQQGQQPAIAVRRRPGVDRHAVLDQLLHERGVVRRIGREGLVVLQMPRNLVADDRHIANLARLDVAEELAEADAVLRSRVLAGIIEQHHQRHDEQEDDDPEREISKIRMHIQLAADLFYVSDRKLPAQRRRHGASALM